MGWAADGDHWRLYEWIVGFNYKAQWWGLVDGLGRCCVRWARRGGWSSFRFAVFLCVNVSAFLSLYYYQSRRLLYWSHHHHRNHHSSHMMMMIDDQTSRLIIKSTPASQVSGHRQVVGHVKRLVLMLRCVHCILISGDRTGHRTWRDRMANGRDYIQCGWVCQV